MIGVACTFNDDPGAKQYTYKFNELAADLEEGDLVVVENDQSSLGRQLVRVAQVGVDILDPAPFDYKWIVGKVEEFTLIELGGAA